MNNSGLYEQAFHSSPYGIGFMALDGKWIKINGMITRMLGYLEEELASMSLQEVILSEDIPLYEQHLLMLLDGKASSFIMEGRMVHKEGRLIWTCLDISLLWDDEDKPRFFLVNLTDISEKKAIDEKYHEIENLYKLISDNAQDIISYTTPDGICRYCTPSMFNVLGYEPREIMGNTTTHLFHEEDIR